MRRTRPSDLLVPFVVIGITVYALLRFSYTSLLQLDYLVPVPIVALAAAEFVAARRVRAAVRHDPNAKPMAAIVIARCVALGKASSLGLVGRLLPDVRVVKVAASDARVGSLLFLAAALLVGAGLLLERAGVDPGSD
jgi:hypothetical protein